jgi:NADPH-dependent glutamate synthase beta subunit-like oxidoreductase
MTAANYSKYNKFTCRFHSTAEPLYIAIVGTGPSGFYTAKYLLEKSHNVNIDMIELLPVPFGLVRYGVAPDHPEVKTVIATFTELFEKYKSRIRYFGNIQIGSDSESSIKTLRNYYAGIVLAYGASSDRSLGLKGLKFYTITSLIETFNSYIVLYSSRITTMFTMNFQRPSFENQ